MNVTGLLVVAQLLGFTLQGTPELWHVVADKWHPLLHITVALGQAAAGIVQIRYDHSGRRSHHLRLNWP